jgi:glycosyltransferase involved in cell wall biosynthesis
MLSAAHPPTDLRIVGKEGAALAAAGWRVTHLAPAPLRGAKDVPASLSGVEIITYPRPTGWLGRIRGARALAKRAARFRPDVIHAHEPDSWYAAILASGRTGAAVVLDVHEHYPSRLDTRLPGLFRGLGRRAVLAACRWMAARADAVVVAKDGLEDAFPDSPIIPVRNYAAEVPVQPRIHRQGPVTLVHLGALTRERGAFEMLRALSRCPEGTHLSLIGRFTDSSETDFLSEAKRLGIAGAVERHGWLPHPSALALAAEADIGLVLFQPGHENHRLALPHKLFDCMLAGIPVIVPEFAKEVAEVVREAGCGMLVNTADPDTIAEAVRTLSDPQLRAEMGAAGRAAALGRFGWASEAERLTNLYHGLAPLPAMRQERPLARPEPAREAPLVATPEPALAPIAPPQPAAKAITQQPAPQPQPAAPAVAAPPVPALAPAMPPAPVASAAPPPVLQPPAPEAAPAAPRLLLDAAPAGPQDIPPALAAILAREAPEPASPEPPPFSGFGLLPAAPPTEPRRPVPAPDPSAALGSMMQALRNSAPQGKASPPPPPEQGFSLIASLREAVDEPPARQAPPAAPAIPALASRPVVTALPDDRPRLLQEAGLSGNQTVPASVAALLARPPEALAPMAATAAPITSDVPLVEAALRAADQAAAPGPAGPWRLLEAGEAPPPLPKAVAVAPQSG